MNNKIALNVYTVFAIGDARVHTETLDVYIH